MLVTSSLLKFPQRSIRPSLPLVIFVWQLLQRILVLIERPILGTESPDRRIPWLVGLSFETEPQSDKKMIETRCFECAPCTVCQSVFNVG